MPDAGGPVVHLREVSKDYRGLRPLRIRELTVGDTDSVALLGFDEAMAATLVDLLTGALLPDSGEVIVFGEPTASVNTPERWMSVLDRFGLVSDRSVLLEQLTVEQNLAIPLSLEVERMNDDLKAAVRRLSDEIGLTSSQLSETLGRLPPAVQLRVRLGRALALDPRVLLAEHPNARLSRTESQAFASDVARIRASRGIASVVCTADRRFARDIAAQVLVLRPATGELVRPPMWPWR
jgi:predicted ABC-type transport system involved in lysophospholipase L1 biosynthesis ATPase subunit